MKLEPKRPKVDIEKAGLKRGLADFLEQWTIYVDLIECHDIERGYTSEGKDFIMRKCNADQLMSWLAVIGL